MLAEHHCVSGVERPGDVATAILRVRPEHADPIQLGQHPSALGARQVTPAGRVEGRQVFLPHASLRLLLPSRCAEANCAATEASRDLVDR